MDNYPDGMSPRELERGREPEQQWFCGNAVVAVNTYTPEDAWETLKALRTDDIDIDVIGDFCDEGHALRTVEHYKIKSEELERKLKEANARIKELEQ